MLRKKLKRDGGLIKSFLIIDEKLLAPKKGWLKMLTFLDTAFWIIFAILILYFGLFVDHS